MRGNTFPPGIQLIRFQTVQHQNAFALWGGQRAEKMITAAANRHRCPRLNTRNSLDSLNASAEQAVKGVVNTGTTRRVVVLPSTINYEHI